MSTKYTMNLLTRCGWAPDRQVSGQPLLQEYEQAGFEVCEELKNQVRHVSGLCIPQPRGLFYRWAKIERESKLRFWTTLRECSSVDDSAPEDGIRWESSEDLEQIPKFQELCARLFNKRVLMVGESVHDDLLVYIDEDGGLFSDGYGGRFHWGETFLESMVNYRRLTPIKSLD